MSKDFDLDNVKVLVGVAHKVREAHKVAALQ
jgi:hypothetical protein